MKSRFSGSVFNASTAAVSGYLARKSLAMSAYSFFHHLESLADDSARTPVAEQFYGFVHIALEVAETDNLTKTFALVEYTVGT